MENLAKELWQVCDEFDPYDCPYTIEQAEVDLKTDPLNVIHNLILMVNQLLNER